MTYCPVADTNLKKNIEVECRYSFRGCQVGDGMGGGRNGCFWGVAEKRCVFQGCPKSGRPNSGRSYHHLSHLPLDALWQSVQL